MARPELERLSDAIGEAPQQGSGFLTLQGRWPGAGVTRALEEQASTYDKVANTNRVERIVASIDFAREGNPRLCQLLMSVRNSIVEALDRKIGHNLLERAFVPFELAAALWWQRNGNRDKFLPAPYRSSSAKLGWSAAKFAGAEWLAALAEGLAPVIDTSETLKTAADKFSEIGLDTAIKLIATSPAAARLRELVSSPTANPNDIETQAIELFALGLKAAFHQSPGKPRLSKNNNPIYLVLFIDAADETLFDTSWARRMRPRLVEALKTIQNTLAVHCVVGGRAPLALLSEHFSCVDEIEIGGLEAPLVERTLTTARLPRTILDAVFSGDRPGPVYAEALAEAWAARDALPPDSQIAWQLALQVGDKKVNRGGLSQLLPQQTYNDDDIWRLVTGNGNIWFMRDDDRVWLTQTIRHAVSQVSLSSETPQ